MNITLRQLQVFEKVARRLSFTRAAHELYLTQPAVSMQIKLLEQNLGLPLLERLGKKLYLTEAGREVYRLSRSIATQLQETEQILEALKGTEGGTLTISVVSTVHYFAIRALANFCQNFPKVRIDLKVTNRKGLLRLLEENATDLALMGKPPADWDLIAEPFMDNPLVVIAPPSHPLSQQHAIALDKLEKETFLIREQGSGTRGAVESFFTRKAISISGSMEMNTNTAIIHGVAEGLGLGIVSLHTIRREIDDGSLVVLDVESFPLMRKWYLAHRSGKKLSRVAQAFKDFVRQRAWEFMDHGPKDRKESKPAPIRK